MMQTALVQLDLSDLFEISGMWPTYDYALQHLAGQVGQPISFFQRRQQATGKRSAGFD
jgi:hypothetical protein